MGLRPGKLRRRIGTLVDAHGPRAEAVVASRPATGIAAARFVVLTGTFNYTVRRGLIALFDALPDSRFLVVLHAPRKSVRRLVRSQWRNLKRHGWRWIPYVVGDLAGRVLERLQRPPRTCVPRPGTRFDREHIARDPRVELLPVQDIHAPSTLQRVRDFGADLGLSLAAPILKPDLYSLPRLGTINLHKGKLPEYRGMPPAFWEVSRGEREVGCTVHVVEASLDTGPVVRQTTIPVHPYSTVQGLRLTLDEVGVRMMRDAALDLLRGRATLTPQPPGGTTFRKPTLAQERAFARRLAPRRERGPREIARRALDWSHARLLRPLPRRVLGLSRAQRVVVLLYRRVRDDVRDCLTVGIEQLDAQMSWLARHCPLADITDVVTGRVPRDTPRPPVAVTFDGGDLDGYDHAFPILLRHRIPAAFFVPAGRIGAAGAATMDWDHLREIHAAGFTIGCMAAPDFAFADPGRARAELRESRDLLAERLSVCQPILADPSARREDVTAQALDLVRDEGYAGRVTAYGGFNEGRLDPFDVRRTPIHHGLDSLAFEARLDGWR